MSRLVLPVFLSAMLSVGSVPLAFAASSEPQLNFKIYSPEPAAAAPSADTPTETTPSSSANENIIPAMETGAGSASATTPAESETATTPTLPASETTPTATEPTTAPMAAEPTTAPVAAEPTTTPTATETTTPAAEATTPMATEAAPPAAAETTAPPEIRTTTAVDTPTTESTTTSSTSPLVTPLRSETPVEAAPAKAAEVETTTSPTTATDTTTTDTDKAATASTDSTTEKTASNSKALQGYIRVVPLGTRIPIIMDTAVDSETSQEGDEFTARTAEDLSIDGGVAVPAGSIIKGRIAQMNAPKHLDRSGSVALKFDTVTTPDNRQIPLVANLVAHGGVVHAKRGLKDIAIDSGTVLIPVLVGLGIGALAGNSNTNNNNNNSSNSTSTSKITKPEAAMIGAGIGLVVGVAILCAKKGKKVDVRPGDELKIELAEDLRMPMM